MIARTMDEQAASQEGAPIPADVVMVARLVERDDVTSERWPIVGTVDPAEFAAWAGGYLASMTAEGMPCAVIVERWTREAWEARQ